MTPSAWKSTDIDDWQKKQLIAAGDNPSIVKDDQLRFLRLRHVIERSGLSKSAIYRGIAAGKFPAPIALKL
jgi:predicted DNA-binding transcriptional regulator AlpA